MASRRSRRRPRPPPRAPMAERGLGTGRDPAVAAAGAHNQGHHVARGRISATAARPRRPRGGRVSGRSRRFWRSAIEPSSLQKQRNGLRSGAAAMSRAEGATVKRSSVRALKRSGSQVASWHPRKGGAQPTQQADDLAGLASAGPFGQAALSARTRCSGARCDASKRL